MNASITSYGALNIGTGRWMGTSGCPSAMNEEQVVKYVWWQQKKDYLETVRKNCSDRE